MQCVREDTDIGVGVAEPPARPRCGSSSRCGSAPPFQDLQRNGVVIMLGLAVDECVAPRG